MYSTIKPRTTPRKKRIEHEVFAVQLAPRKAEKVRKATRKLVSNTEHLGWLAAVGSVISGSSAVVHHLLLTPTNEHGTSQKASDDWGLPLTPAEHDALHRHRNGETDYLALFNIHGPSLAALLRQLSGHDIETAHRAIRQHREAMAGQRFKKEQESGQ